MEEQKNMTAERSLEIITHSIEQSRRDIERGSWKYMLLWGVSVSVIALVVGHLWKHYPIGPGANGLWGLLGFVGIYDYIMKKRQPRKPLTFISKNINYVWSCFGVMAGSIGFTLGLLGGSSLLSHTTSAPLPPGAEVLVYYIPITCIIIFSMGVAGMITGCMLRNKLIVVSSFLSGAIGSILSVMFAGPNEMIVLSGVSVLALILPALVIRFKENGE